MYCFVIRICQNDKTKVRLCELHLCREPLSRAVAYVITRNPLGTLDDLRARQSFFYWDRICTPLTFFRSPFLSTSLPRRASLGPIGTPAGRENDYHYQTDGRTSDRTVVRADRRGRRGTDGRAGRMTLSLPVVVCRPRPSLLPPPPFPCDRPSSLPFRRPSAARWSLLQHRCIFPFSS